MNYYDGIVNAAETYYLFGGGVGMVVFAALLIRWAISD